MTLLLGRYQPGPMLGQGSFGTVVDAYNVNTLRRVAVKVIRKEKIDKMACGRERLKREMTIMKRLRHENVVEFIEAFHDPRKDRYFIVLELVPGGSLRDLIDAKEKVPCSLLRSYFLQLLDGMEYMHNKGIIHGDIKPSNLLLSVHGKLKISDFGTAQSISTFEFEVSRSMCQGAPAFQPPEITKRGVDKICGFKLDIWSFGVVLCTVATHMYPFEGSGVHEMLNNVKRGHCVVSGGAHPLLRDLIEKILQKDPEKRPSINGIRKHRWFTSPLSEVCPPGCLCRTNRKVFSTRAPATPALFAGRRVPPQARHERRTTVG